MRLTVHLLGRELLRVEIRLGGLPRPPRLHLHPPEPDEVVGDGSSEEFPEPAEAEPDTPFGFAPVVECVPSADGPDPDDDDEPEEVLRCPQARPPIGFSPSSSTSTAPPSPGSLRPSPAPSPGAPRPTT